MHWFKVLLFAALVLAHVTSAPECVASEEREPIRLEYFADGECPSESEMLRRLLSYTTRWTRAAPDEDARRFVLRIGRRGKWFVGRFDLTRKKRDGGNTIRREVEGDDCGQVATGLAVAVALAIDPGASLAPEADAPPSKSPLGAPPPSPPARPDDSDKGLVESAPPLDVVRAPRPRSPTARPNGRGERPVAVSVGGRVELTGALSGAMPVVAAFVEIAWPPSASLPWFAPTVRLGARQSLPHTIELSTAEVSMLWSAAFVELCPARLALGDRVLVSGCLAANVGVLSAKTRDLPGAEATYRAWFDYGGVGGVRWQVHPRIFVALVGGVVVPVTRDRFRLTPDGAPIVAPRAGGFGGLGAGWRF